MKNMYFEVVKKNDGRIEQFELKKIIESVFKSFSSEGRKNKKIVVYLTRCIFEYLKREHLPGETIITDKVRNAVENILSEKKYYPALHSYKNHLILKKNMKKHLRVSKKKEKEMDVTDFTLLVAAETDAELSVWNKTKIIEALVKEANIPKSNAYKIACNVEKKVISSGLKRITTSLIREIVDNELLSSGYVSKLKKQTSLGIPTYNLEQIIFSKSLENSNITAHNPEAINLAIAETTLKQYALNNIFSRDVTDGHLEGVIHIHDLGYPARVYCSSHSLEYIKKYGLNLENLEIISKPAKHARTLTGHLNTYLASMQAYYAGALGIGYINIFYAPFLVGMSYNELIQEAQYLIFSLSQSAFSRGGQALFLDANIHTGIPSYMKNIQAIGPGGKPTGRVYADYERESQMFARALLDVWRKGDAYGHLFAFPKCDLHVNDETLSDPKQREILEYACLIASENGTPYFVFDRDEVTLSACCRLRTTITDNYMLEHPESMRFCGFQNVTINLPQAAYRAGKGNIDQVFKEINKAMDLAVKAHLQKKSFIKKLMSEKGLPLYQIGKNGFDGRPYVDLEKATYIIGLIGLNECVQSLTGKQLHEDEDIYRLGLKIISSMYLRVKEYEKKYNLKFSLEESPAESAARRLSKVDLQKYPQAKEVVKGNLERDEFYYTNSIHFAADAPISIVERIEKQSKFHSLIESGAILHAFVGEEKPHPSSIMNLIEKTFRNTKAAQLTISPEFTICRDCHRTVRGLKDTCIRCGSENVYGITRIVGYFSIIANWNKSKIGELKDRHAGDYSVEKDNVSESSEVEERDKVTAVSA